MFLVCGIVGRGLGVGCERERGEIVSLGCT